MSICPAIVGVACYSRLTKDDAYMQQAKAMAARLLEKIGCKGNTPLSLDGKGWSMKYNLLWDRVLGLGLLPDAFYEAELKSCESRVQPYGLPLGKAGCCGLRSQMISKPLD